MSRPLHWSGVIVGWQRRLCLYSSTIFEVSNWSRTGLASPAMAAVPTGGHSEGMAESTPTPAQAGHGYQLRVGDPDQMAVSVALAPQHSLVALIRQAASGATDGRLAALRQRLHPRSGFAFGSFAAPGPAT